MVGVGGAAMAVRSAVGAAWRPRLDPVVLAAAALVLAVPVVAVASALRHPWVGITDWAQIETAVRDVGTADTPLVGAHSRFGWHHPGPWPYYLMAARWP
jgi:hypothetical protein